MNRETAGVVTSLSNWLDGIDTHTVRQFKGQYFAKDAKRSVKPMPRLARSVT